MNIPQHTYRFDLYPCGRNPIPTECIIKYRAETTISNTLLETIARTILSQATLLWLQGGNMCLDDKMNMDTFKSLFKDIEDSEMLRVLKPFKSLVISNDWVIASCPELNNVRIYME